MIDDATSELFACFFPRDTGLANRLVLTRYLATQGRMGALYVDRASHFGNYRSPHGSIQAGEEPDPVLVDSIIQRGLRVLEIELILALSPQAKGRVERLFGTLQDRLIKEMRVAQISSMDQANRFLQHTFIPFWNRRFTVPPGHATDAHRPLPPETKLETLFAETKTRVLREDYTFRHHHQFWQIEPHEATELRPKQKITIERRLDGSVHYRCAGRYLHPVPFVPVAAPKTQPPRECIPYKPKPAPNHPWRRPVVPVPQRSLQT